MRNRGGDSSGWCPEHWRTPMRSRSESAIDPGNNNPPHSHPNCDEVLHVIRGTIRHRVGDDYVEMGPGDTISIPAGQVHNATNTGDEEAEFLITFSTAYREVVGE
ncbi:cupin domain-containing protein [Lysobacter korlensis]|uniref:Cupin domain-containing protein n=1 Tax=Lysobacter korlensis TaxID=553636 RepID=A0ABV6RSV5_9GAMM